ncbi:MAG: hypothetical protein KatS3mg113_0217 [Planctomycetaceae bacterium]|nr:MAG: hypothetical protein KatS3mg113_0217 [Planctomycetaceae bacterium]
MDGWNWGLLLAQTPAQVEADAAQGPVMWAFFAVITVVFIVPFVLGHLLGRWLRLRDLGFQMGVVLWAIFMSLSPFAYRLLIGQPWYSTLHLGIDLAGGTNLIYAVDVEQVARDGKTLDKGTMDKLVGAISRRINPSGAEEVTVRRVGEDRVEVIIPGADREVVEQKKRLITRLGSLEFAILANEKDHRRIIEQARKLPPTEDVLREEGRIVASWRLVAEGKDVRPNFDDRTAVREVERPGPEGKPQKRLQFLVVHDSPERAVTGKYLVRAQPSMDDQGQLAVHFQLNAKGGQLFSQLTGRYRPDQTEGFRRRLAVLLNGEIHTAPEIRERIGSSGQITGNFTRTEVDELVNVLNAGALEVPLIETPVSEFTVSPLLGVDVQTRGVTAIIVSAVAVFVFMVVYYLLAGVVADLCLVLNLLLVVGAMAFIEATFTLPGLAGLVLTIGMAVDSNVLIYERMREELARGASLRMAIENGFDKAYAPIIDSNLTTLITAVILYIIGSDQIRGFAVSLFIGLTMSLFSTLYFGHLCFKVLERKRWIRQLKMLQLRLPANVDFLAARRWAFGISAAFILLGLAVMWWRGERNLDIDFTGGTMVTFEFTEPEQTETVRAKLSEAFAPTPVSLERLVQPGESAAASEGRRFRVRLTETNQQEVARKINEIFTAAAMPLKRVTMELQEVGDVPTNLPTELSRFQGGSRAVLRFSSGLTQDSILGYFTDALQRLSAEGRLRYDEPESLVEVRGGESAPRDPSSPATLERYLSAEILATAAISRNDFQTALQHMQQYLADNPVFEEINAFDTSVSAEMQRDAILAILASMVMIVIYIWFRFERLEFGLAAIVALAHDVLVTLAAVALAAVLSTTPIGAVLAFSDFKINLVLIASLLTIVGYSLNDTIVIFDRLREIRGKNPNITYDMINLSVNQTLSRTILTALTVLIVVVILYIFGGDGIHGFAYAMIIGTLTGCYSTIYIANPVVLWLVQRQKRLAEARTRLPAAAAG